MKVQGKQLQVKVSYISNSRPLNVQIPLHKLQQIKPVDKAVALAPLLV